MADTPASLSLMSTLEHNVMHLFKILPSIRPNNADGNPGTACVRELA